MTDFRPTDKYATYRDVPCVVVGTASPTTTWIRASGERRMEEVPTADLGPVEKVVTSATWRGGRITLHETAVDGAIHFYTRDQALAEREHLTGDWHSGWQGGARPDELSDVDEVVTPLDPNGRPTTREDDA